MLNVSQTYKGLIKSYAREFSFTISRNSTVLTDAHILDIDIEEAGFSAGELNIGEFCRNSISITAGIAENVTWQKGDVVSVQVQVVGATDVVPMGVFTVNEVKRANDYTILITGYDVPAWYSETFDQTSTDVQTNIAYTETAGGMSLTNKNLLTTTTVEIPEGITLSNMDYLRYVAGLDGFNIRSNRQGNLELYKVTPVVTNDPDDPIYIDYIDRENILEDGLSVNDTMTSIDSFTIISAEGYEYHTGTGYGITNENPFVTEDTDKTKMTGYLGLEYYAAEVTFRGDPSLQIGDIVGVPYNDETVPTIIMSQRFKIDGGISCVIGSQTSQEEKEIVPVSPTNKKINSVQAIANAAQTAAEATNQHFWHRATDPSYDGAGTGAFVTDEEQDDFLSAIAQGVTPTQQRPLHNLLMNAEGILLRAAKRIRAAFTPSGVAFYDGQGNNADNIVAAFGTNGAQIGSNNDSRLTVTASGLLATNAEGMEAFRLEAGYTTTSTVEVSENTGIITSFPGSYIFNRLPVANTTITVVYTVNFNDGTSYSLKGGTTVTYDNTQIKMIDVGGSTSWETGGVTVTLTVPVYLNTSPAEVSLSYSQPTVTDGRTATSLAVEVQYTVTNTNSVYFPAATLGTRGGDPEDVGAYSFSSGMGNTASGRASHAEGYQTVASAAFAHAEGQYSTSDGLATHAEGFNTTARMNGSHSEGILSVAKGDASHAQNMGTIASGAEQTALGRYNIEDTQYAVILGNGTDDNTRSNALTVDWSGNVEAAGTIKATKQESTVTVNTTNVTVGNTNACWHNGVVASLSYNFTCKSSLANNDTLAVGTLPSGYVPMYTVVGSAYTSNASVVEVTVNTSGVITIRNVTGSAIATTVTIRVGATYAI